MLRKFLIIALLVSVPIFGSVMVKAYSPQATTAAAEWQELEAQADDLMDKAFKLTRADNNPLKADYARASQLYAEASSIYALALTKLRYESKTPEDTGWTEKKTAELTKALKLSQFKSYQNRSVVSYRERWGLP
jgi:hypothetical protein